MTKPQQKALLIVPVVVIASYFVHSLVTGAVQLTNVSQFLKNNQSKGPNATAPGPAGGGVLSSLGIRSPQERAAPFMRLVGFWENRLVRPSGLCDVHFELRPNPDEPGTFLGFPSMTCISPDVVGSRKGGISGIMFRAETETAVDPEAAIMAGEVKNGALQFHLLKVVGADANGCSQHSFSLVPFGAANVAVDWTEDGPSCQGGRLIMKRISQ